MTDSRGDEQDRVIHDTAAPLPDSPDFYRRVLQNLPSPVVVLNDHGKVIYVNQALLELGGWNRDQVIDHDFLVFMHPQDRDALAQAFMEITENPEARVLGGRSWSEIYFRIVTADGSILPVELVGNGGLLDEAVGGIIYEVRPATGRDLLGRLLDGLSQGASMHHQLSLLGEMIASPPLDLQSVIFQSTPDGALVLATSTSPELSEAVRGDLAGLLWERHDREPVFLDQSTMPAGMHERLRAAGFQDTWHVGVESPLTETTLRIVAASPTHHVPANGPYDRLVRTRDLAAAVLLRTQADVLLDYAAAHDPLTDLPNRAAFYQLAESLNPMTERAALHLDLDGLTRINTELGQAFGDSVLQIVADRLRVTCSPEDIIARIGDDEFTIMLAGDARADITDNSCADRALKLAAEVLKAIHDTVVVAGKPLNLSTSIGVAIATPGVSTDHLLTWADAAMHDAKRLGGGRICRFGVGYG